MRVCVYQADVSVQSCWARRQVSIKCRPVLCSTIKSAARCIDDEMMEPIRKSVHITMRVSIHMCIQISTHMSLQISMLMSIHMFMHMTIYMSTHTCLYPCLYTCLYTPIQISIRVSTSVLSWL